MKTALPLDTNLQTAFPDVENMTGPIGEISSLVVSKRLVSVVSSVIVSLAGGCSIRLWNETTLNPGVSQLSP